MTAGKLAKPRTSAVLNDLIDILGLHDLGNLKTTPDHTWRRRGIALQSSRIDYILTSAEPQQSQYINLRMWHTHLDHCISHTWIRQATENTYNERLHIGLGRIYYRTHRRNRGN